MANGKKITTHKHFKHYGGGCVVQVLINRRMTGFEPVKSGVFSTAQCDTYSILVHSNEIAV